MPKLPRAVQEHVDVFLDALQRTVAGAPTHEVVNDIDRASEQAFRAALSAYQQERPVGAAHRVVTFDALIADRLRRLREEAGWTQAKLASAMADLSFGWQRVTVAEIERAAEGNKGRRVSLEELVALAALYGVPVWELLVPADGEYLRMPDGRSLAPMVVGSLFYGADGIPGEGGFDWEDAARVANVESRERDRRPARDLWRRRAEGYGTGLRDKRGGEVT